MNSTSLLLLALMAVAFWLLVLRPARTRQRDAQNLQNSIAVGDEVMTGSGIFGTVVALDDERFQLEVSPGVQIWFLRPALSKVVESTTDETEDTTKALPEAESDQAQASEEPGVKDSIGTPATDGAPHVTEQVDAPETSDGSRARTSGGPTD